jgi:hypothetical protein
VALTYRISHGPVQVCSGTALLIHILLKIFYSDKALTRKQAVETVSYYTSQTRVSVLLRSVYCIVMCNVFVAAYSEYKCGVYSEVTYITCEC